MKKNDIDLSEAIRRSLEGQFESIEVLDVFVIGDNDEDDNEILNIYVSLDGVVHDTEARKISSAVRKISAILEQLKEDAFPLMSFMTAKDFEKRKRELEAA